MSGRYFPSSTVAARLRAAVFPSGSARACFAAASAAAALLCGSCVRRAEPAYLAEVLAAVELDAASISAGSAAAPANTDSWHHFGGVAVRPPVRVLDSRSGMIYEPAAILAELDGGEKIVICSLAPANFHVYRLAPFTVPWTRICPHDLNYVAQPPAARPPP